MKTNRIKLVAAFTFTAMGLVSTQAQTTAFGSQSLASTGYTGIGFNFVGTGGGAFSTTSGVASLSSGQTAGVLYQANWNNDAATSGVASGSVFSLIDSTGATTGVNVAFAGPDAWSTRSDGPYASFAGDGQLLNGYLDSSTGSSSSTTFSNISFSSYNIYVYVMADGSGRNGNLTLSGATTGNGATYWQTLDPLSSTSGTGLYGGYTQATSTTLGTYTAGNYVEFTGVTGSSFTISNIMASSSGGIAGIQVVDATAVPEPSTYALLLGGLGMVFLLRRRSHASR